MITSVMKLGDIVVVCDVGYRDTVCLLLRRKYCSLITFRMCLCWKLQNLIKGCHCSISYVPLKAFQLLYFLTVDHSNIM
jgi:hypothetical protein